MLGLIVLKVGCGTSIPIYVGLGLEGRMDEKMMGWADGKKGKKENEPDTGKGGMGGHLEEEFTIVGQMDRCLEREVIRKEWRMESKGQGR